MEKRGNDNRAAALVAGLGAWVLIGCTVWLAEHPLLAAMIGLGVIVITGAATLLARYSGLWAGGLVLVLGAAMAVGTGIGMRSFIELIEVVSRPLPAPALTEVEADYLYWRHPELGWVVPRMEEEDWSPTLAGPLGGVMRARDVDGYWEWVSNETGAQLVVISLHLASDAPDDVQFEVGFLHGAMEQAVGDHERTDRADDADVAEGEVWLEAEQTEGDRSQAATGRWLTYTDARGNHRALAIVAFHHVDDDFTTMLQFAHVADSPWLGPGLALEGFHGTTGSLIEARAAHPGRLLAPTASTNGQALSPPIPPFIRVSYEGPLGAMPAYLAMPTGTPRGGVLWLHGGFAVGEEIGPDWGPAALAASGIAVLVPTLRGEPGSPGQRELFLGEVDDARAALTDFSRRSGLEAADIVVVGHSTGGTLALLLAESGIGVRAVVCFGPMSDAVRMLDLVDEPPFPIRDIAELWIRSPVHFVGGIASPTYVIEGEDSPNALDTETMADAAEAAGSTLLHATLYEGDHFSVVMPITMTVAANIDRPGPIL
jgi:acetyl esterase/lipase